MFKSTGFGCCLLGNVRLSAGLNCPTDLLYKLVSTCTNTKTAVSWLHYKELDITSFDIPTPLHEISHIRAAG
ncbi:hypothetical protein COCVIDRAFT_99574 [Bipolaris victoriae FI3]|uniref:Uncharacterized protein n=1 Tax=Bipolaris victoriae (strain FI3) TaxID=930091 RepID=W7ESG5_BIPV3|nr:hypothetical protein COCVIDRAFT_99574 [Bipolaris victoriae FI3]